MVDIRCFRWRMASSCGRCGYVWSVWAWAALRVWGEHLVLWGCQRFCWERWYGHCSDGCRLRSMWIWNLSMVFKCAPLYPTRWWPN